jgi:hypothetical protein
LGLLSLADSAVVALHAAGSDTGVVVDCGYDSSHVTTVYAGHSTLNHIFGAPSSAQSSIAERDDGGDGVDHMMIHTDGGVCRFH